MIGIKEEYGGLFGQGELNSAFAQYFIGNSYLKPLTNTKNREYSIFTVTFEPGCRNNWRLHHAQKGGGQILLCVDGEGRYQEERKAAQSLKPGDAVTIPAGVKRWHGAEAVGRFSHLAVEYPGENTSTEWLEAVNDEEYQKFKNAEAFLLRGACHVMHDIIPIRASAIRRRLYLGRRPPSYQDKFVLYSLPIEVGVQSTSYINIL